MTASGSSAHGSFEKAQVQVQAQDRAQPLRGSLQDNTYIYLHGFASSPRSSKATFVRDRLAECGHPLIIPDLNQPDFSTLTLTRQIEQVTALIEAQFRPVTLIGSSFGGLTAAWLGDRLPQVTRLILLAPAFDFMDHWLPKLGPNQLRDWKQHGSMAVYHYGDQKLLPLQYGFIEDMAQYPIHQMQRPISTLILHGLQDEVIPVQASRTYASQRSWVRLVELDSDHALMDVAPQIWNLIGAECRMT